MLLAFVSELGHIGIAQWFSSRRNAALYPREHLAIPEDFILVVTAHRTVCCKHLVGR